MYHLEIAATEGAFGAGGEDAAGQGEQGGHLVLAAQAVLQQDDLGAGGQARVQGAGGGCGVVGLAGQQQAMDRCAIGNRFGGQRQDLADAILLEGQAAGGMVLRQPLRVAQQQAYRLAGAGQAGGPQPAEAAGAKHMPGHDAEACGCCRRWQAMRPLLRASTSWPAA
ncbi:hypothetical protein D3C81_1738170 [compost metagenome]